MGARPSYILLGDFTQRIFVIFHGVGAHTAAKSNPKTQKERMEIFAWEWYDDNVYMLTLKRERKREENDADCDCR